MARLTDHELDLIQSSRHWLRREWNDVTALLVTARHMQEAYLAKVTGLSGLIRLVDEKIVRPLRAPVTRRRAVHELRRLDDHLLRDIGLERGNIETCVNGLAPPRKQETAPRPGLVTRFRRWHKRRATIRQLEGLEDRLLADIGLVRGDIPMVAARSFADPAAVDAKAPAVAARLRDALRQNVLGQLVTRALAEAHHWLRRRATIRELEALDDRMLEDLGFLRSQIPATVDRLYAPEAAVAATEDDQEASSWASVALAIRQWNLSRQAAGQTARLGPDTSSDLGYVKGDVDWIPEVLAERKLTGSRAA